MYFLLIVIFCFVEVLICDDELDFMGNLFFIYIVNRLNFIVEILVWYKYFYYDDISWIKRFNNLVLF